MTDKIPSRRALEKNTADIGRILRDQQFESMEDAQKFLDGMLKKNSGKMPKMPPKNKRDFAQDIMYEAWDTEDSDERIRIAHEALSVHPDCADAYVLLAEETAESQEEAKELYEKGVLAGERDLGKKFFKENAGHFWGMHETRPYMRARNGLAQVLWALGEDQKAIDNCHEMLRLNPGDNQGIRYVLVRFLADLGRYVELEAFLNSEEYQDDCMVDWIYTRVLLQFVKTGRSTKSKKLLSKAIDCNSQVTAYLCGRKSMPRNIPDKITMGGEDEAICYAWAYMNAWQQVDGAIEWLADESGVNKPKLGRNDACSCGSGKKYKKCCGQ